MSPSSKPHQPSPIAQLLINFVIPIVILTRYSSESRLGPTKAMLLALTFPVAYELISIWKRRKVSMLSVIAIGGILVTGAISLLGLSEGWLALRRSIPYLAVSLALLVSMQIKRPLLDLIITQIVDMEKIRAAAGKHKNTAALHKLMKKMNLLLAVAFLVIGATSYVMTRVVITAQTNTETFNSEYARLRVLTLPYITLPTIAGMTGIIMFLFSRLEKLTGLKTDELTKKKS